MFHNWCSGESLSPSDFLFLLLPELLESFVPGEPLGPGISPLSLVFDGWLVEPQSISYQHFAINILVSNDLSQLANVIS